MQPQDQREDDVENELGLIAERAAQIETLAVKYAAGGHGGEDTFGALRNISGALELAIVNLEGGLERLPR